MLRRALTLGACLLLLAAPIAPASAEQSAVEFVQSLYDPDYLGGNARYTPELDSLWEECERLEKQTGDACMDFSMFVMGNDFDLTDVRIEQTEGDADSAVVAAHFKNFGKDTTVTYDLKRDADGWMIAEMRSGCYVLSVALKHELPSC
jgi:hypothetical protein